MGSHQGHELQDVSHQGHELQDISHHGHELQDVSHQARALQDISHQGHELQDVSHQARELQDISHTAQELHTISHPIYAKYDGKYVISNIPSPVAAAPVDFLGLNTHHNLKMTSDTTSYQPSHTIEDDLNASNNTVPNEI